MKVAACAIVKNEGRYLEEWISYGLAIGFDHFFLYDNESSDETAYIIKAAESAGVATYRFWPSVENDRPQLSAYNDCRKNMLEDYDWIAYLDADEFVNLKRHQNIHQFLDAYDGADAIWMSWKMFGSSGHIDYTRRWTTARFTMAANSVSRLGKSIVKVKNLKASYVHTHELSEGARFINTTWKDMLHHPKCHQDSGVVDVVQLNHYFTRSREEWAIKRNRGFADYRPNDPNRYRPDSEFSVYDRNEEVDNSILRWRSAALLKYTEIFAT